MEDLVNKPPHYIADRKIEPIEVIEDWDLDHHLATALKYISRAGRKVNDDGSGLLTDMRKAVWYLERRIKLQVILDRKVLVEEMVGDNPYRLPNS